MSATTSPALVGALTAFLTLAACTGVPQPVEQPGDAPAAARDGSSTPSDSTASSDSADEDVARDQTGEGGKQAMAVPGPIAPSRIPFAKLPGLNDEAVVELLGQPDFHRRETAAEHWQYRGERCVLHLFLYGTPTALRVRHAEARLKPAGEETAASAVALDAAAAAACLDNLTAARGTPTG